MALTRKQQAFVEYYLQTWNATQAAIQAGYSERSAYSIGSENLKKPEIEAAIRARLDELKMSADEVLVRLADTARHSSMAYFTRIRGDDLVFDFTQAGDKLHHLKKVKRTRRYTGETIEDALEIEVYDRVQAQQLLGKHHKLFTDRVEVADWRRELEQLGLDPDAQLDEISRQIEASLRSGAEGADAGGGEEGEGAP